MKQFLLIIISILFFKIQHISQANAKNIGLSIGSDIDIIKNILTDESGLSNNSSSQKDSIFIGGEAFATYYKNNDILNYGYGLKGKLGYSIQIIDLYGFYGYQNTNFASSQRDYFSKTRVPTYGYGAKLNLESLDLKLEKTYLTLENKEENNSKKFSDYVFSILFGF